LNGYLTEWNILENTVKQFYYCTGHAITDMKLSKLNKHEIYLACYDGHVRLINCQKTFFMSKMFSKSDSPILSLDTYLVKSSDDKHKELVCTGHLNGSITKWNGSSIEMKLGDLENPQKSKENKLSNTYTKSIWTIKYINSKIIASGNKDGELKIWDYQFGNLIKSFKEHQGDILSIAYNEDCSTLYYSGCDSLVVAIKFFSNTKEFKILCKLRPQSHDINCLLHVESKNLLFSGGVTSDICLINLDNGRFIENYGKKNTSSSK
jgi:U3 small nucleolar RNA-associated protein 4